MKENSEIVLIKTALADFDRVAMGLALLKENYGGMVFEVDSTMGMAHAKAARAALREPRYEVEKVRKAAKAPLIALGKKLDAEATRITNAIMDIEMPIQEQIQQEEERKEREKQLRAEAEAKRILMIQSKIDAIRAVPGDMVGFPAKLLSDEIEAISALLIDQSYEEFQQIASDARGSVLGQLASMRDAAVRNEAEAEQIKKDRADLARMRAEMAVQQASKDRREREEREAIELASLAKVTAAPMAPVTIQELEAAIPIAGLQYSGSREEVVMIVATYYQTTAQLALELLRRIDWSAT
jgi:hypothetical protein